ncbi:hypothetical protein AZE42_12848 [Rhizopogon vesiculosus]|uniref:Uncharacterized protein n=1 Tax=Rhizopogon vesiculosus TaxID=180088 RepID=A0A1J8Q2U0_9AGAM|nr:hypothetical protein AZE42_12848 [Rhizopogon vesiculosus]
MRNPDIILVDPGAEPVKWVDVISTIEVKWNDQPDLSQKAIGQLADIATLNIPSYVCLYLWWKPSYGPTRST